MEKFISVIPKLTTQDIFSKTFSSAFEKAKHQISLLPLKKKLTRKYTGWQQIQKYTAARAQKINAILTGT